MPPYGLPSYGIRTPHSFFSRQISSYFGEKIPIEPDMDVRGTPHARNDVKALPRPPPIARTKSCLRRCRFGAVVVGALGIVGFVLGLVVVLAGKKAGGSFAEEWIVKVNASRVGEDIIRFERASSTASTSPTKTTSPSNPLDPLNPFSTASPLNPANPDNPLHSLLPSVEPILGNLTDSINDGLGDALNKVTKGIVKQVGIKDFYYLYLSGICKGNLANDAKKANSDGVVVENCESWSDVSNAVKSSLAPIRSSLVIGTTNVSIPLLAHLAHSADGVSSTLSSLQKAILAFLIIALTTMLLSVLLAIPSLFFPASRLLIDANLVVASLAGFASFIAAALITLLVVVVPWAVRDLLASVGAVVSRGDLVLVFVWIMWLCCLLVGAYWFAVWFVEVRLSAFRRRRRTAEEVGNWRAIGSEVWRDWKGDKDS